MDQIRNTKIVCTIGPASNDSDTMKMLVESGMNVMRLNFSHGSHEDHLSNMNKLRKINQEMNTNVAIMLDTKGPEIRTHNFEFGGTTIIKGSIIRIAMQEVLGTAERFSVTFPELFDDIKVGGKILVDDGNITLIVIDKDEQNREIICRACNDAYIKDRRGINVPDVELSMEFISERDRDDLIFGCVNKVDYVAASFVRNAEDVRLLRALLQENNGSHIQIISKIENMEGVRNLDDIIAASDGIMVARGDLGVEVPVYEVPILQKQMIHKCHLANKPVIVATQMLESMQKNPRPTRAEANDVATAVLAGSDAIMLSGETAAGKYPIESVKMMNDIALRMEKEINYEGLIEEVKVIRTTDVSSTIALSVAEAALQLSVSAIITPTSSGFTARALSHYRTQTPIIAITMGENVARSLALRGGVHPIVAQLMTTTDEVLQQAIETTIDRYHLQQGEMIIITCGMPLHQAKSTNMMKIQTVE